MRLASEVYFSVITAYIYVNRMTRRLKGNTGQYAGRERLKDRKRCGEGQSVAFVSAVSVHMEKAF
jgi:hypothetical protein